MNFMQTCEANRTTRSLLIIRGHHKIQHLLHSKGTYFVILVELEAATHTLFLLEKKNLGASCSHHFFFHFSV